MSQDLVLANKPSYLQEVSNDNSAFDAGGSPIQKISIKGGRFRMDTPEGSRVIADQHGNPFPFIDVIMLAANNGVSKTYYEKNYQEGSDAAPDCSSSNGVTPSPDVPPNKRQSANCASCPKNAWGSDPKGVEMGKKLKACRDSKRLAVMFGFPASFPLDNRVAAIEKGQAYLLQIPGGSLQNLSTCVKTVDANRAVMQAVVVRITFDTSVAFPKMIFTPQRFLEEAEYRAVMARVGTDEVRHILGDDGADEVPAAPEQTAAPIPEQVAEFVPPAANPAAAPVQTQAPAQAAFDPMQLSNPVAAPAQATPAQAAFDPTQMLAAQQPVQGEYIPAQAQPATTTPTAEVDSTGAVWDASIHSSSKKKNADGTWKKRRGGPAADAPPATPAPAAGQPAAPVTAHAPAAVMSADDAALQAALADLLG